MNRAILDTGVDLDHEDLVDNIWEEKCYDFYNDDSDVDSDHNHGTVIAGIVGAMTDNTKGIVGLAQVRLMILKMYDEDQYWYTTDDSKWPSWWQNAYIHEPGVWIIVDQFSDEYYADEDGENNGVFQWTHLSPENNPSDGDMFIVEIRIYCEWEDNTGAWHLVNQIMGGGNYVIKPPI